MHRLWPVADAKPIDDGELEVLYGFPGGSRPWLVVNFVASVDGAVTEKGRSEGLSSPGDKKIFLLGRDLADVVMVGAGTVLVEGYRGVRPSQRLADRRRRHGMSAVPPVAVVTRQCSIPPDAPVIVDTSVPTIVLTCAAAPLSRREALAEAGAEVLVRGANEVDLAAVVDELAGRGLRRICCEGGPRLFGSLIEVGLVDEVRLTVSPLLTAGDAGRIATGTLPIDPVSVEPVSVLADEGALLLRYLTRRERDAR